MTYDNDELADPTETQTDHLPPLSPELIDGFAARIQSIIKAAIEAAPGSAPSEDTMKFINARVPPKTLPRYATLDEIDLVVWDEALAILERIFAYPYAVQYRKHLKDAPEEVRMAWQIHSHSLRGNELYVVQDRTTAFLDFLHAVARDLDLRPSAKSKTFETESKKLFRRRLLERHEVTHAKMRPSLTSRIINMQSAIGRAAPEEREPMVVQMVNAAAPLIDKLHQLRGKQLSYEEVEQVHEEGARREARQMLDLFGKAVLATLNIPVSAPSNGVPSGEAGAPSLSSADSSSEDDKV